MIVAADEDTFEREDDFDLNDADDADGLLDAIDDVSDNVDDLKDSIDDDVEEDSVDNAVNNNIEGHYIAECDGCNNVFISAILESDQQIDHVSGICPVCGKETDQHLKWIIRGLDDKEE